MEKHPIFRLKEYLILLKWHYSSKWSTDSGQSLSKFSWPFCRNGKSTPKLMWNYKGPWTVKSMKKKNKAGQFTRPNFKNSYKATQVRTVLYWYRDRHNQEKRNENTEMIIPTANWCKTRMQDNLMTKKSLQHAGVIWYPHETEWSWTLISHHIKGNTKWRSKS